jgi:hypothetical protein
MPRAEEVELRVRAYGQQGVEFALSGPKSYEKRSSATWFLIGVLLIGSSGVLSAVEWGVSSPWLVLASLVLAALAAWIFQASGNIVVEGVHA